MKSQWVDLDIIATQYKNLFTGFRSYFVPTQLKIQIQDLYNEIIEFRKSVANQSVINYAGTQAERNQAYFSTIENNKNNLIEFCNKHIEKINILQSSKDLPRSVQAELAKIKNNFKFLQTSFMITPIDKSGVTTRDLPTLDRSLQLAKERSSSIIELTNAIGGIVIPSSQYLDPFQRRKVAKKDAQKIQLAKGTCKGQVMDWKDQLQKFGRQKYYIIADGRVRTYQDKTRDLNVDAKKSLMQNNAPSAKKILSSMKENNIYRLALIANAGPKHAIGIRKLQNGYMEFFDSNIGTCIFKQEDFAFWLIHLIKYYDESGVNFRHYVLDSIGKSAPTDAHNTLQSNDHRLQIEAVLNKFYAHASSVSCQLRSPDKASFSFFKKYTQNSPSVNKQTSFEIDNIVYTFNYLLRKIDALPKREKEYALINLANKVNLVGVLPSVTLKTPQGRVPLKKYFSDMINTKFPEIINSLPKSANENNIHFNC